MESEIIVEQTGPPIGDAPEHTHETPVIVEESPEEIEDDIDELAEALAVHSIISEQRHEQILEEVAACQTQLETLSTSPQTENPLLTQITTQLAEIRAELLILKSSMATMSNRPPRSESEIQSPEEPNPERLTEEPSVENEPPKPARKNRFV
jgi:hypothetical protein